MCLRGAGDGLARSNERPRAEDDDVPALVHAQQAHGSGTTYSRRAARERADDGQSQGLFQRTLPRLAGPLRRARHLKHRSEDLDVNEITVRKISTSTRRPTARHSGHESNSIVATYHWALRPRV